MPEPTNGEPLTPLGATRELARAARYEDALRQRTEGLTWMIWGFVTPGIFLSYALAGATYQEDFPLWAQFLFAPWVVAGVLATYVLWSSAQLVAPRLKEGEPKARWASLGWILAIVLVWIVAWYGVPRINEPTLFLLWLGTVWTVFGAINIYRCSVRGRYVSIFVGLGTLVSALLLAFLLPQNPEPAYMGYVWATAVAVVAGGLFPLLGGAYQALRG